MSELHFNSFSEYIEYALQRSIGFTRFGASDEEPDTFRQSLRQTGTKFQVFETDTIFRKRSVETNIPDQDLIILVQNVTPDRLPEISTLILQNIIYPCYFRHIPVYLFSIYPQQDYQVEISSRLLHTDQDRLSALLRTEQIFNMLGQMSPAVEDAFDFHSVPAPQIQNLIEDYLTQSGREFKSNIRVGHVWFDFIIKNDDTDVGLLLHGCDIRSRYFTGEKKQSLAVDKLQVMHLGVGQFTENVDTTIESLLGKPAAAYPVDNNLDQNQRKAATHLAGPIRVLAPAGAGKTKTLINRVLCILNAGVAQGNILALAFNKKAAIEMEKRLQAEGVKASRQLAQGEVAVMTFHAFGYKLLQELPGWHFDLKNAANQSRQTLQEAVTKHYQLQFERNSDPLEPFDSMLTRVKMDLLHQDKMQIQSGDDQIDFMPVFLDYLALQSEQKFLSFDDMLYLSLRLILDDADLRARLQRRFEYVLVDEFQDLNRNQLLLIEILAMPQNNLFIVGDDDQMIYGWRGAHVSHILNFHDSYSESADSILSRNYRSVRKVVEHSRWLIDHNQQRVEKDITPRPEAPAGRVELLVGESLLDQAEKAVHQIRNHQAEHDTTWSDYAVLYRYNSYQFIVAAILDNYAIPHSPVDERRLFQTGVGRDFVAYLKVLQFPEDAEARDWRRILKRPNKYISNELIENVAGITDLESLLESDIMPWQQEKLSQFIADLRWVSDRWNEESFSAGDVSKMVFTIFGLREFYQKKLSGNSEPDMATDLIVMEVLENYVSSFDTPESFYSYWKSLEDPERIQPAESSGEEGVQLSTIHSTKGNEYRHVIYFNLSDTVDQNESELEQERRVTYVGATRAIESLLVTIPDSSYSRFAPELLLHPEFYGVTDNKLQRLLKRLRKQRRNEEKSTANFSRAKHQTQLNVFSSRHRAQKSKANQEIQSELLDEIRQRIDTLENELYYRSIFFPKTET